jgi:hypothetical protein
MATTSSSDAFQSSMDRKLTQASITEQSIEAQCSPAESVIVKDDIQLEHMGYRQHMKRGFTMSSMTAFCLTGLGMLPSIAGRDSIFRLKCR